MIPRNIQSSMILQNLIPRDPTPAVPFETALPAFLGALDDVLAILRATSGFGEPSNNQHYTCRAAVDNSAKGPLVVAMASDRAYSFPTNPHSAHAALTLEGLAKDFQQATRRLTSALEDLALVVAHHGYDGLSYFPCAVGVDVNTALGTGKGWISPGRWFDNLGGSSPGHGHDIASGAFADAMRVAATANGWNEGPLWRFTYGNQQKVQFLARDAETAFLRAWAVHCPILADTKQVRHASLARVEPDLPGLGKRCLGLLAHRTPTKRARAKNAA